MPWCCDIGHVVLLLLLLPLTATDRAAHAALACNAVLLLLLLRKRASCGRPLRTPTNEALGRGLGGHEREKAETEKRPLLGAG